MHVEGLLCTVTLQASLEFFGFEIEMSLAGLEE